MDTVAAYGTVQVTWSWVHTGALGQRFIWNTVQVDWKWGGFLSTHVLHQAEQLCDRIMLIDQGTKILDDTMDGIRNTFDPRTIEVEPAAGSSLPEVIEGVHQRTGSGEGPIELHLEDMADPNKVMQQVIGSCAVRSIKIRQLTLDEVFVSLVRDRAHETHTAFALDGATP